MPDSFTLPDTPEVRKSRFVLSQPWFEERERCRECGKLYNQNLAEKNRQIGAGEITWAQYYARTAPSCPAHQESLEAYLERVTRA